MVEEKVFTPNDLVAYYGDNGGMESAGYLISSVFDGGKLPPIVTINGQSVKGAASLQTGGNSKSKKDELFSSSLRGLAVPFGLATLFSKSEDVSDYLNDEILDSNMDGGKKNTRLEILKDNGVVPIPIYDRLLELMSESSKTNKKPRITKKKSNKSSSENKNKNKKLKKARKTKKLY
jgi:hypothetical protein